MKISIKIRSYLIARGVFFLLIFLRFFPCHSRCLFCHFRADGNHTQRHCEEAQPTRQSPQAAEHLRGYQKKWVASLTLALTKKRRGSTMMKKEWTPLEARVTWKEGSCPRRRESRRIRIKEGRLTPSLLF